MLLISSATSGSQAADVPAEPAVPAPAASLLSGVWVVRVDVRTGRLVRVLVPSRPAMERRTRPGNAPTADSPVRSLIEETARNFDVSPLLVDSVVEVESNYNPFAVSPKGAQGLMQLMPATARRFGVTDTFDPKQNVEAGVRYLKLLEDTFQDDRLALAAYNAGAGAVAKYGDVPPYPETVNYVAKVGQKYGRAKRAAANSNEKKSAEKPQPAEDEPRHVLGYVDAEGRLHIATR